MIRENQATSRQLRAWDAYLAAGSMREAAHLLGVHEQTIKRLIGDLRDVYGVRTLAQLAVALEHGRVA
jgi:DNA-binding transcriptional LysR family regulator